jgi:hypothetical protein
VKLAAADGVAYDWFGRSVSIWGDVAIVGATGDSDSGSSSGSAYVFRRNGLSWTEEQKLTASDGTRGDKFGISVSVCGDMIIVGAHLDDVGGQDRGSAYVYRWNGMAWEEKQKLLSSDGAPGDFFGRSVSINGDVAVVGAHVNADNGAISGSAYVFRWNGVAWMEEQKLLPPDNAARDGFGYSVSTSGRTAVVGAYGDDDNGLDSGSAYVFQWNGISWVQQEKLLASDGADHDSFGDSVCIQGDTILVGAPQDYQSEELGAVYVFRRSGIAWVEEQKIPAPDDAGGDLFGFSVSISDETAIVGALRGDDGGENSGSAHAYRRNGTSWVYERSLLASDGGATHQLGSSVAICGDVAIVGARFGDANEERSGSAYIYSGVSKPGCASGTVNLGAGPVTDLLLVNGLDGGLLRTVTIGIGDPIAFSLAAAPAGPDPGNYLLWVWHGPPSNCTELVVAGQTVGCTINPAPLQPGLQPQPAHCLLARGVNASACGDARVRRGPTTVPWMLKHRGLSRPAVFSIQGIVQDRGAANTRIVSVTNAMVLMVE